MPVASLRLPASPDQVRTARLVAAAAARRSGVPEEILDEVRLAVGEATARAVLRHRGASDDGHVDVTFHDRSDSFVVEVRDGVPAGAAGTDVLPDEVPGVDEDLSLALIEALPDEVTLSRGPSGEVLHLVWFLGAATADGPDAGTQAAPA